MACKAILDLVKHCFYAGNGDISITPGACMALHGPVVRLLTSREKNGLAIRGVNPILNTLPLISALSSSELDGIAFLTFTTLLEPQQCRLSLSPAAPSVVR
jgi:hypothetical protein